MVRKLIYRESALFVIEKGAFMVLHRPDFKNVAGVQYDCNDSD